MQIQNLSSKRLSVYVRKVNRLLKKTIEGKEENLNDVQISSYSIIKKLIKHDDSDLIYSPISNTYYIENGR